MPRTVRYNVDVDASRARAGAEVASRSVDRLTRRVTGLAAAYASLSGIRSLGQLIERQAEFGASLVETAEAAGLTVRELQELRRAFAEDGAEIQQTDSALVRFNSIIGRAAEGTKEQADAFRRLGIDVRDAQGNIRSSSAILDDLARSVNRANYSEVVADLQRLVGEEGLRALTPALRRSGREFQAARDRAAEFGAVSNEQANDLKDLSQTLSDLADTIQGELAQAVSSNSANISDFIQLLTRAASGISEFLEPPDAQRGFNAFTSGLLNVTARARAAARAISEVSGEAQALAGTNAALAAQEAEAAIRRNEAADARAREAESAERAATAAENAAEAAEREAAERERLVQLQADYLDRTRTAAIVVSRSAAATVEAREAQDRWNASLEHMDEVLADAARRGDAFWQAQREGAEDVSRALEDRVLGAVNEVVDAFGRGELSARRFASIITRILIGELGRNGVLRQLISSRGGA